MKYVYLIFAVLTFSTYLISQEQSDLQLYLSFTGEITDQSPYSHLLTTARAGLASDRNGEARQAARFDGRSDQIVLADTDIIRPNNFTVAGWLNFEGTLPSEQTSQVITKYRWDNLQRNFRVACEDGQLKVVVWYGPERPDHTTIAVPLDEGVWNHFAFSLSSENILRVYLNGCLVGEKQQPAQMPVGRSPIRIGNADFYGPFDPADNHHFNGRLDEIRIYSTTLPESEIEFLAEQEPDSMLPEPELQLTFNGSTADSGAADYQFVTQDIDYGLGMLDTVDGGALLFNGVSTELVLQEDEMTRPNDFTMAGWFNFAGVLPSQQTSTILSKYTWDNGERNFRLECLGDSLTLYMWYGFTLDDRVEIAAPIQLDTWHHFNFTLTSENLLSLYLDGCLVGTEQLPSPMRIGSQPLRIGNSNQFSTTAPGDNHHFHGLIDEIQYYNHALSPCQLPQLMVAPYSKTTTSSYSTLRNIGIDVFPNPAVDVVRVRPYLSDTKVTIYDSHGRLLPVRQVNGEVDLRLFPAGVYVLRVASRDGIGVSQIIKR